MSDNMYNNTMKTLRGGAVVARRAHNPKVVGSNPTPATNENNGSLLGAFSFCI